MNATQTTPLESRALWNLHRTERTKAQRKGACRPCSEQVAFAATDEAEGKPPRKVDFCGKCKAKGL